MDFNKALMRKHGHGLYEQMQTRQLPPLYIAFREELSECSDKFHNSIRERFDMGDKKVVAAMAYWARLTDKAKAHLENGSTHELGPLLDANFNKRRGIYRISRDNINMVDCARAQGASAKFTGSGGAIVGTYEDQKMFSRLKKALGKLGIKVIKPKIIEPTTLCSQQR